MKTQPISFEWREVDVQNTSTGEVELTYAMVPSPHHRNAARRQFGDRGQYTLEPVAEQDKAHGHGGYMASMTDYWNNLPEAVSAKWPSANHFRRWCLIECGFYDQREIACASAKQAQTTALFMRELDEYARIAVNENVVVVRRAKSQSPKTTTMDKNELKASRKAVEDLASSFVGVSRSEMRKHAGRHA